MMRDPGRHGRNLLWVFLAEIYRKGLALFFFIYLSRAFDVIENGYYGLFIGVMPVFVVLLNAGFYDVAVRDIAQAPEQRHVLLPSAWIGQLLLFFPVLILTWGGAHLLQYPPPVQQIVLLTCGVAFCSIAGRMCLAVFAAREEFGVLSALDVAVRTLIVGSGILIFWRYQIVWGILCCFAAGYAVLGLWAYQRMHSRLGILHYQPKWTTIRYLFRQGVPIAIGGFALTGFYGMDMPLLHAFGTAEMTGYYAIGIRFFMMLVTVPDLLDSIFYPMLSRKALQTKSEQSFALMRCVKLCALLAWPVMAGTALISHTLVSTLCGSHFSAASNTVTGLVFLLGLLLLNRSFILFLRAHGKQHQCMWVLLGICGLKLGVLLFAHGQLSIPLLLALNLLLIFSSSIAFVLLSQRLLPDVSLATFLGISTRPLIAALLMSAVLWPVHSYPIAITIPLGGTVYILGVWLLGVLDDFDWQVIRTALPGRK